MPCVRFGVHSGIRQRKPHSRRRSRRTEKIQGAGKLHGGDNSDDGLKRGTTVTRKAIGKKEEGKGRKEGGFSLIISMPKF